MKKERITRHHIIPKSRVNNHTDSQDQSWNRYPRILMLWKDHHVAWHILFDNATLKEIIKILQKIERLKHLN
jgi:hypothetical protein